MSSDDLITVYCSSSFIHQDDGGSAFYSFVVYCNGEKSEASYGEYKSGPNVTSNIAEYGAVIKALQWLVDHGYNENYIELKSSNQVLIRQLNSGYQVSAEGIFLLVEEIWSLSQKIKIKFTWVSGKENTDAKELARLARDPVPGIEYEKFRDCYELRWKFVLHGNVCRIYLECFKGGQWIREPNEPYYERIFEPNFLGIHYNKFREKFARDIDYRQQWCSKGRFGNGK